MVVGSFREVKWVIPRLHGWVYKTLRLSPLVTHHSVEVMSVRLNPMGSQGRGCWGPVEDSDTGGPSLVTIRMEYLLAFQYWYCQLCVKTDEGEAESIVLLIFVLWWCLNLWCMRGGVVTVLFRASWNHIFFHPSFFTFKSNLILMWNITLIFSNILLYIAVICRCSST